MAWLLFQKHVFPQLEDVSWTILTLDIFLGYGVLNSKNFEFFGLSNLNNTLVIFLTIVLVRVLVLILKYKFLSE